MTADELLRPAAERLRAAGIDMPAREARLLLSHFSGIAAGRLMAWSESPIGDKAAVDFEKAVLRRAAHEPLSRIFGRREFWSLEFQVTPATLDPRADSETLVAAALDHIGERERPLRVLDLGTGTGCLLLSLLSELPNAWGLGIDRSPEAARVAQANAAELNLCERAGFLVGDWAGAVAGRFDLIVSNPPYIPGPDIAGLMPEVRLFDPPLALDGGEDGLAAYRRIAVALPSLMAENGLAVLEAGHGQMSAISALMTGKGLQIRGLRRDLGGIERALILTSG